ncbi:hypothetical protein [Streptomyces sp. RPT161]|uniref:hypothetical protein n=1 Tax=Streptomyces sp. RPT161 TaxID=3015993 RepID=UPI0022B8FCBD|nr:hypothetical protein [Streptomyces sp. RPT161]
MSGELIKPEEIPQFTGNVDQLESDVTDLRNDAGAIAGTGSDVHSTFQGLSAFYEAPEAEQLFATTKPVADAGKTFGDDLKTVAGALSTYASEVKPIAAKLKQLRSDAEAFVADAKKDHDWQYDSHKVDRNNDLRKQVDTAVAAFWDAEIRCANAIDAIFGGTRYVHNDGSNKSNMYGYTADQLDGAKGLPWGDAVDLKYHWYRIDHWAKSFVWDGLIVDGIWGTLKGLGGLVGLEGWDTFVNSWKGLGELAVGLASYSVPFGYLVPDSALPGWVQESRKTTRAFGKSLVAWDEWGKDPARAAGGVVFNALTLLAGGEGVAAKAGTVGKVVGVLGKAGKFIDPMTYVAKGAGVALKGIGDLPKVAAAMDALKGLKDQAVFNVKGLINVDALKARFGSLPDGTVPLPDGGHIDANLNYHAPDGTVHEPVHEPSATDRATASAPDVHVEAPAERQLVTVGGGNHDLAPTLGHDGGNVPSDMSHGGGNHEPPNAMAHTDHQVHNSTGGGREPQNGFTQTSHDAHNSAGGGHGTTTTDHGPGHSGSNVSSGTEGHHVPSGPTHGPDVPGDHSVPGEHDHGGSGGHHGHRPYDQLTQDEQREVVRQQVQKANHDPEWFKKHYNVDGHRHRIENTDENGYPLAKLKKVTPDAQHPKGWIAADDAPPPIPPKYKHVNPIVGDRATVSPEHLGQLDEQAARRDHAVAADQAAEHHLDAAKQAHEAAKHTQDANAIEAAHNHLEQAKESHSPLHSAMNKASEEFGDNSAEYHAIPHHYPDAVRVDNRATGNNRFDQIWQRHDGHYVVVEAKGSPKAELGHRQGLTGRSVKQGTREYFETILKEMRKRAATDPQEAALERQLRKALKQGKVDYVLVKAVPNGSEYAGYLMKHFDIG